MGILSGSYKYMKGRPGSLIPSESSTGQLSMFPHGYGSIPTPRPVSPGKLHKQVLAGIKVNAGKSRPAPVNTGFMGRPRAAATGVPPMPPPFKGGRSLSSGNPRSTVQNRARTEELKQKDADDAINQQNAMDTARASGQITDREIVARNKILMRRRKRALV